MHCNDWPNIPHQYLSRDHPEIHYCISTGVWVRFDTLVSYYNSGGHQRVRLACSTCHYTHRDDLSHKKLSEYGYTPSDIPVVYDNRTEHCERCGVLGAELHHWAPAYKFDDSMKWPTSYLCGLCHRLWHITMDSKVFDHVN